MHVGLNLVFLVPGETGGMEPYARELVTDFARRDFRVTAFINQEAAEAGGVWTESLPTVTVPVNARSRVQWVRGEQQYLPRLAQEAGCDLVHSLASTAPLRGPFRRVVTIHDVIYARHPEAHFGIRALGMRMLVPLGARRSHRVIAISRSTRDDLVELLKVPSEKIDIVPRAAMPATATPTPEADLRRRFELGDRRILLTVSAKRPHKNLKRLLEAHALLPAEDRPLLVLPGYPTEHEVELRARATELAIDNDVRWIGWTSDADLEGLYAAADLFVFPSLYEGFGLPVLEAMQRGVAVACSDRSSLPEVAGDAARLFDPEDVPGMAQQLRAVLDDPAEAERLRTAGLERAKAFSWTAAADQTVEVYRRTLAQAA